MKRQHDTTLTPGDAEFAARVGQRLRDSADSLDAQTRSRLNQARQQALEELSPRPLWQRRPALAGAAAAVAMVALLMWQPIVNGPEPAAPLALDAPDLELLMTDESLDMLEDLEFYTWLAAAEMDGGAAG
jgi:negative regulator of sigma E activity